MKKFLLAALLSITAKVTVAQSEFSNSSFDLLNTLKAENVNSPATPTEKADFQSVLRGGNRNSGNQEGIRAKLVVRDKNGGVVYEEWISWTGNLRVHLSHLPKVTYTITVVAEQTVYTEQMLIR